jgi:hypothetical protein
MKHTQGASDKGRSCVASWAGGLVSELGQELIVRCPILPYDSREKGTKV